MANIAKARSDLLQIFRAAVKRVEGRTLVREYLEARETEGVFSLVAVGKAAGSMARGAVDALGERLHGGLVVSKPGHLQTGALAAAGLQGLEGGHPVPDAGSLAAGKRLLAFLDDLPPGQPLLFLISGGASSLVEVLPPGMGLKQLQAVNRWLLGSGLPITAMNRVRKGLSTIKGGRLLSRLGERRVLALMISDVPGDDPAVIGSGLLVPDPSLRDGLAELALPGWLREQLDAVPEARESPRRQPEIHILGTLREAREAAAAAARDLGYQSHLNHAFLSAEAENCGRRLGLELLDAWPGVHIWGGEPSVRLPANPGRGGRNQHLALALATVIEGRDDICFLSGGTDGTDGPGEDAGALVDGGTLGRARRAGFDAREALARADAGSLLAATGDLVRTGPTGTNVMDLMLGLKLASG
ncbi:MAG TPA: DUF4147 domain-containing protein [Sedimenticola sp.]|nr:DUF4147 domain-containing protein [Sedimenticola sp.]